MPRSSSDTRSRLLRAGEEVFARVGVRHGRIREVVRLAAQANDSAVHYHFGSREGLVLAIYAEHIEAMEPARRQWLAAHPDPDLPDLVDAVVGPLAERLETDSGRKFLQIAAQVAGEAGIGTAQLAGPLERTAILAQLQLLHDRLAADLPPGWAAERVAGALTLMTAVLATHARAIDGGIPPALSRDDTIINLRAMVTGLLTAPPQQDLSR
ncbi:TetR/AcrR family transcriptional regulator [Nocardioides sp.]|uniref:TetR/AcrR family transcriptional regulator n=1 Tax=Nocardioides sp. TaxID=35761 RepID=UPI0027345E58|nr:TetR/AcrR family transcriptional regulator [Nocardioides sp.]MDP3894562.1 TetR/AcrR family transcriptional regulator [Nocardioides sp.]